MQPDVFELALVDRRQRLGHAVDERLDADEARARMLRGFGDQMLAAAEAAFQPDLVDTIEQRAQIGRRGRGQIEPEPRQQRVHQRGLALAQRMALAPAEEGAGWFRFAHDADNSWRRTQKRRCPAMRPGIAKQLLNDTAYFSALFSWLTRLVCSQEKPPSFSGARPKWP